MGRPLPLTSLFVLAVFAVTGGIIWLAYGDSGSVLGEPPLIRASATPLKQAPDDPGGRRVAELGGVGDLLADQPGVPEERLMPTPEQPLSPAEATVARLGGGADPEELSPKPEERSKAKAALEALVTELIRSETPPSGVGGPATARLPSPPRKSVAAPRPSAGASPGGAGSSSNGVQLVATEGRQVTGDSAIYQGTPGGRFRIQLAAVREEADAKRAWSVFQERLGSAVDGLEPFYEMAETNNGRFYRVQIGPFANSNEAEALCIELKEQDASCFIVRR